jgi:hypothetical protein
MSEFFATPDHHDCHNHVSRDFLRMQSWHVVADADIQTPEPSVLVMQVPDIRWFIHGISCMYHMLLIMYATKRLLRQKKPHWQVSQPTKPSINAVLNPTSVSNPS